MNITLVSSKSCANRRDTVSGAGFGYLMCNLTDAESPIVTFWDAGHTLRSVSAIAGWRSDDAHEFAARSRVGAELTEQLTGNHRNPMLANATCRHALMFAFDDYADSLRPEDVLNTVGNLCRHGLLDLQAPGEGLDDSCKLADADDLSVRKVTDMGLADNRCHMVLAMRFELNIPQYDHLVVAVDLFEGSAQKFDGIFLVAAAPVFECPCYAPRSGLQALAIRVLSDPSEQRANCFFGILA